MIEIDFQIDFRDQTASAKSKQGAMEYLLRISRKNDSRFQPHSPQLLMTSFDFFLAFDQPIS
jgi:hypothetical protein